MTSSRALAIVSLLAACADVSSPALTRIMDARRLTDALRAEVSNAANASDRAVMSDSSSSEFAEEARRSTARLDKHLSALEALIKGLDFEEEGRMLAALRANFDSYRALDADVLALAVENTNAKAQRLSFGPAHEAADRLQAVLEPIATGTSGALALRAALSVRQIEALTAPHIAALEDSVMSALERQMDKLRIAAHAALGELAKSRDGNTAATTAQAELARFDATQAEIIQLSRRNSDVRSLALSLGEKLQLVSSCRAKLDELSKALDDRASPATR